MLSIWNCRKIGCLVKCQFRNCFPYYLPEDYSNEIDDEKKKIIELDAKIREWERKIKNQHKNMGGVHMSSQHTVQTQKTLRTLENRLDSVCLLFLLIIPPLRRRGVYTGLALSVLPSRTTIFRRTQPL